MLQPTSSATRQCRLTAIAVGATTAITLTACGGTGIGAPKHATPAPATASEATAGGELRTAESATVLIDEQDGDVTYEITAHKVELSTPAEAAKAVRDPADAKGMVLATAYMQYTHTAGPALTAASDVNDHTGIYADGVRGALLIGVGDDAPGCEDPYAIGAWHPGESHTLCESYLVPAGARELQVRWSQTDDAEPYSWTFAPE